MSPDAARLLSPSGRCSPLAGQAFRPMQPACRAGLPAGQPTGWLSPSGERSSRFFRPLRHASTMIQPGDIRQKRVLVALSRGRAKDAVGAAELCDFLIGSSPSKTRRMLYIGRINAVLACEERAMCWRRQLLCTVATARFLPRRRDCPPRAGAGAGPYRARLRRRGRPPGCSADRPRGPRGQT